MLRFWFSIELLLPIAINVDVRPEWLVFAFLIGCDLGLFFPFLCTLAVEYKQKLHRAPGPVFWQGQGKWLQAVFKPDKATRSSCAAVAAALISQVCCTLFQSVSTSSSLHQSKNFRAGRWNLVWGCCQSMGGQCSLGKTGRTKWFWKENVKCIQQGLNVVLLKIPVHLCHFVKILAQNQKAVRVPGWSE